jgi:hypothetical protein
LYGQEEKPETPKPEAPKQEVPKIVLGNIATPTHGNIMLTVNPTTEIADKIAKLVFLKNGQLLGEGSKKEGIWSYEWNSLDSSDDVWQIAAQVTLGEEQATSPTVAVTVDNTPPSGQLILPTANYLKSPLLVKVEALDKTSGIAQVSLLVNEQASDTRLTLLEGYYTASLALTESSTYQITTMLVDQAGNRTTLPVQTVKIDNKPPQIRFAQNPPILLTGKGSVAVYLQDEHAGVAKLRFGLDNLDAGVLDNPGDKVEAVWDIASASDSNHVFMTEATDKAGNTAQENISVIVDRTPPQVSAQINPSNINLGMVHITLKAEDALSGLDTTAKPRVVLSVQAQEYAVACGDWQEGICRGQLLVNAAYPEGEGKFYVESVQDKAGNNVVRMEIGVILISDQKIGGGWPLAPSDSTHAVLPVYSPHVKKELSALWITAKPLEEVKAIEEGRVVELLIGEKQCSGYLRIARLRGDLVWGYYHLIPGDNPEQKRPWLLGDMVKAGDILGTVTPVGEQAESYLYLELMRLRKEGYQPAASPLAYLVPSSPLTFASAKILLASREVETAWQPYLHFELPLDYSLGNIKPSRVNEQWVVGYFALLLLALGVIALLSKSPRIPKSK